jgi:starch phosphorylase
MSELEISVRGSVYRYLPRMLPDGLEALSEMALDMRWSWNHEADAFWERVDPELWEATGNPWLILQSVSSARLAALSRDHGFMREVRALRESRDQYLQGDAWFTSIYGADALKPVAYFSMEFGLSEALPIYAGGLGILAGDQLKTASDLAVPLIGVGLLYQQGYFRQSIGADGNQVAVYPYNNPAMLPITPVRDASDEWLRVAVELLGRTVYLRAWQVNVGRVKLYLLDSNDPLNLPADRGITGELYSGGPETRLQQEILLGIGGWRLLRELGLDCEVCHLNEGHPAFVVLERARDFMQAADCTFQAALRCTRAGNIFTTHTPVAAGFDRFTPELMASYFRNYARTLGIGLQQLLAFGRAQAGDTRELFNMAYLAMRGCGSANAVSRLHGRVSQRIFQPLFRRWPEEEVAVGSITNGVHVPSWDSSEADTFWTENCSKARWVGTLEQLEAVISAISDEAIWSLRSKSRAMLVEAVRRRSARHHVALGSDSAPPVVHLDPNVLTMGFARRFAGYKRPNLLLHDPEHLTHLLTDRTRPIQLVVAGKAHPADDEGKRMIRQWTDYARHPEVQGKVVFLEDYDLALAAELVQGVDLWINTPRRPWEACGTSGMKLLVNGGLNLSELDGWWAEAYSPEVGWALGDGQEHEDDPDYDAHEAAELYRLLEQEIIPAFYNRDERAIPVQWVARIRASLARLTPRFSSNRMVREYVELCYLPAARHYRRRAADKAALAGALEHWHESLQNHWSDLHFGNRYVQETDGHQIVRVQVYFGRLDHNFVRVELYANGAADSERVRVPMERGGAVAGAVNGWLYETTIDNKRPADDYTPRVVPYHPEASVPLEAVQILWFR